MDIIWSIIVEWKNKLLLDAKSRVSTSKKKKKGHRKLKKSSGWFIAKFPNQGMSDQIILSPFPSSQSMHGSSQKFLKFMYFPSCGISQVRIHNENASGPSGIGCLTEPNHIHKSLSPNKTSCLWMTSVAVWYFF